MFYYVLIICLHFCDVFGNQETTEVNTPSSCTTPENRLATGICINIKSCPALLELLTTRGREPSIVNYLRRSQCGTENNSPKVCCPRTEINQTTFSSTGGTDFLQKTGANFSQCGKSELNPARIVGGIPVYKLGDWPWMAALGYTYSTNSSLQFDCAATLISSKWLVTAAHCIWPTQGSPLPLTTARFNDLNLKDNDEDNATPIDIPIAETIPHPNYTTVSAFVNDVALVRLKNDVEFTKFLRPICLLGLNDPDHRKNEFYVRKLPFVVGWGDSKLQTSVNGSSLDKSSFGSIGVLEMTLVEIVNYEKCAQRYQNISNVLCVAKKFEQEVCQGDSGVPLIMAIGNTYYLAGIVSYGYGCADAKHPGIYTRIAEFTDWIVRTAGL